MSARSETQIVDQSLNRHLFIVDNYQLLKSIDTASVDLICTDPPFAKNETFVGGLTPALTSEEKQRELTTLKKWGITGPIEAEQNNVTWPTDTTVSRSPSGASCSSPPSKT